jgi:hypothetical protein
VVVETRQLLSKAETRKRLGDIGTTKLNEMIRDGRIQPTYLDGRTLFEASEVDRVIATASTTRTHRRGGRRASEAK